MTPTPIKAPTGTGFLRILAAHSPSKPLSANTIHADACEGVQIDPKRLGALFKAAADAGYIRLSGPRTLPEKNPGPPDPHRKRTSTAIPAHVCEVSAA